MYRLPTFNILVNYWRAGNPVTNVPDVIEVANFTPNRRTSRMIGPEGGADTGYPAMTLLIPWGTDVRGDSDTGGYGDVAEIPAGSGRMYNVRFVDLVAVGFSNQHIFAVVSQIAVFPPGPPASGWLLLESVGSYLLEDNSRVLLE